MRQQNQSQITGRHDPQIDGSNHCILRVDRDCVERIHRAYAVAMALPSPRPQAGWEKAGRREKREESTWPQARITSFLRCPVAISKKFRKSETATEKYSLHIYGVL